MIPLATVLSTSSRRLRPLLMPAALVAGLAGCALPSFTPPPPIPASLSQTDDRFVLSDGAVLPARTWLPEGLPGQVPAGVPRMAVLALHGMNDSRDGWELPGAAFAREGIAVYASDQRGFGAAPTRGRFPGSARLVADAAEMLAQLRARHPGVPVVLMGESMGGAVAMVLLSHPELPQPDASVLLAPAVWGRAQIGLAATSGLWLVANVTPGLHVTGRELPIRILASDNQEALLRLARNPLTLRRTRLDALKGLADLMQEAHGSAPRIRGRVLALSGARDDLVPPEATAAIWRSLPADARKGLYPAGYHLLLRDRNRAAVVRDILTWLDDPGAWLPSGADAAAAAWLASR